METLWTIVSGMIVGGIGGAITSLLLLKYVFKN